MRVRLDIPPGTAQLDTWGNGPGGGRSSYGPNK